MNTTRKTRAQRVQLEQAGIPPSPPQALTDEPKGRRPKTRRTARSQNATGPSTGAEHAAAASTEAQVIVTASTSIIISSDPETSVGETDTPPTTEASVLRQQEAPQGHVDVEGPTASTTEQPTPSQSAQTTEEQSEEEPAAPISEIPASFVAPNPSSIVAPNPPPSVAPNPSPLLAPNPSYINALTQTPNPSYINASTQTPNPPYINASTQTPRWAPTGDYLVHQHLYHPECSPFFMELPGSPTEYSESDSENELVGPSHKRLKAKAIAQAEEYDPTKMFDARGNLRLGPPNPPNPYTYRPVLSAEKKRKRTGVGRKENEHHKTSTPDRSSELQTLPQAEHTPETSFARGWGLTSLLPSVKSVSKFFPFPTTRTPSADTKTNRHHAVKSGRQWQTETLDFDRPNPNPIKFAHQPYLQTRYGSQTNLRQQEGDMDTAADEVPQRPEDQSHDGPRTESRQQNAVVEKDFHDIYCESLRERAAEGASKPRGPRLLDYALAKAKHDRAMAETAEQRTIRKQQEEIKAQQEELAKERDTISKERARLFSERRKIEAELEAAQVPGTKRKRLHTRLPSPSVIPNPTGVGFGMDLAYFGHSDTDSDSDEEEQDSPTRARSAKKIRQSLPENEILGDPHAARPYTGTKFAAPGSPEALVDDEYGGNLFNNQSQITPRSLSTPPAHTTQPNSFKVPSPSDSDSDEDEEHGDDQTPTKAASSTPAATEHTSPTTISTSEQPNVTSVSSLSAISETEPMIPPPRPNPSHASLPPASSTAGRSYVDAVEKARQKALIHQPRTGSRLRESSRLSTSTVGVEGGEGLPVVQPTDADKTQDEFEYDPEIEGQHIPRYDPAYPGLHVPFKGTQHPSASLVGQRNASANMPPGHVSAYDVYIKTVTPRVREFLEQNWDDVRDTQAAIENEEARFVEYQLEQQAADTSNIGSITASSATVANFPSRANFTNSLVMSDKVKLALNAGWTPADADAELKDLDLDYDAFMAARTSQRATLGAAA